jgi:Cation transporting ATPase, C-terminus
LAAVFVYLPLFRSLLGTEPVPPTDLLVLLPFPFVVWGVDEIRRYLLRRWHKRSARNDGRPLSR